MADHLKVEAITPTLHHCIFGTPLALIYPKATPLSSKNIQQMVLSHTSDGRFNFALWHGMRERLE
ncbi:MAG: hypothetical protein Q8K42_02350 [Methylobacter sp.]|uniref:hypothetical protein n=1 Tax=Methylobacter sp. TaxID=2051955 RepID=UPI00273180BE|nr:hypothetical protein [Methylobacter sp.]MDP1969760.1 hypothetical protein [Methylobacter sp.]